MDAIQELLSKIIAKTREIEEDYPELQKYLDEQRITLPKDNNETHIDKQSLEDYLNSLQSLIDNYEKVTSPKKPLQFLIGLKLLNL